MKVSVLNTCLCAERFEPPELFIIMTDDSTVGKLTVQLSKASMTLSTYSTTFITGASRRLEPVIKCCWFLSFFQCLVSRAPLSAEQNRCLSNFT